MSEESGVTLHFTVEKQPEFPADGFVESFGDTFFLAMPESMCKTVRAKLRTHKFGAAARAVRSCAKAIAESRNPFNGYIHSNQITVKKRKIGKLRKIIRETPGLRVMAVWMQGWPTIGQFKILDGGKWQPF